MAAFSFVSNKNCNWGLNETIDYSWFHVLTLIISAKFKLAKAKQAITSELKYCTDCFDFLFQQFALKLTNWMNLQMLRDVKTYWSNVIIKHEDSKRSHPLPESNFVED